MQTRALLVLECTLVDGVTGIGAINLIRQACAGSAQLRLRRETSIAVGLLLTARDGGALAAVLLGAVLLIWHGVEFETALSFCWWTADHGGERRQALSKGAITDCVWHLQRENHRLFPQQQTGDLSELPAQQGFSLPK